MFLATTNQIKSLSVLLALGVLTWPDGVCAQPWLDNNRDWSTSSLNTNVNSRSSDHLRVFWGNADSTDPGLNTDFGQVSEQLAQGNLQMLEIEWHILHDPIASGGLGIQAPSESLNPAYRDGNFYRTSLGMNQTGIWGGGAWGSCDSWGFPIFGLPPSYLQFDPPSGATPHEYGHTVLINAGGFNNTPYDGMWHEAFANWQELQIDNDYPTVGGTVYAHAGSLPHGRDYYDAWPIFEYLKDDPRWGSSFINTVITQAHGDQSKYNPPEYLFDAMARLDTSGAIDKLNDIKDALGECQAHCLTWDFKRGPLFKPQAPLTSDFYSGYYRRGFTELEKRPGSIASGNRSAWYRVPWSDAPSQGGFDFIPIALNGKVAGAGGYQVGVNFQPLWDGTRGSDWRATLVAVNDNGDPRYSRMWNCGVNSVTLSGNENKLYLVVAATPRMLGFEGFSKPRVQDAILQPQAFEIAFVNTAAGPYESRPSANQSHSGMSQHANGGGWKANTATVDATAYLGPDALVLDNSQVRGNARIEDYAVVRDSAQVRDNAIVSGHALIRDTAQVYDNARVRDWGTLLNGTQVYGDGKVLERAYADNDLIRDNGVVKGWTYDYVDNGQAIKGVYGYGIKEGDCANGSTLDHGVLTCWAWGFDQAYADGLPDIGWRYCEYAFENFSPIYAKDTYGMIHGCLMGGTTKPSTVDSGNTARGKVLALNGTDHYVELHKDVCDFRDCTISTWVNWNGGNTDQVIWSMGDGTNKYMALTLQGGASQLSFAITSSGPGGETALTTSAIPTGTWTHLAVTFSSSTITLSVNGVPATSGGCPLRPCDLMGPNTVNGGNCNYLGRGNAGNYFNGQIDLFAVYVKALSSTEVAAIAANTGSTISIPPQTDNAAPSPNPPAWLQPPTALDEATIQMSANVGTDASGFVEYYFTCTSGGGHDSGWISANRYTDCALAPGANCAYTVKMRDRWGNTTADSPVGAVSTTADSGAPTPNPATFASGPIGSSLTSITMTATKGTCSGGLVEYNFTRDGTTSSGWQSSPNYTFTGLVSGSSHTFTVQLRNGRGVTGTPSAPSASVQAADNAAPMMYDLGEWVMRPYATIDNCVSMTARAITDSGGVQYSFECTSGGGPGSGWIDSNTYKTPTLADGAYTYRFRVRQKDVVANVTRYSQPWTATINPNTGYHAAAISNLANLQDHYLASFTGTVVKVNAENYQVADPVSGASITVKPNAVKCATDLSLAFKTVSVNGHLFNYTNNGLRLVTYATLTTIGSPPYSISGAVTNSGGAGLPGITVYFSAAPNASTNPVGFTVTDANGKYNMPIVNGTWYVCAGSSNFLSSADRVVVMNSANVTNINFGLLAKPRVSGIVTDLGGTPIGGASVWFSLTPDAAATAAFSTTTDASGNYNRVVDSGSYYLAAGANNYFPSADRFLTITAPISNIDFALPQMVSRVVPQPDWLLFSCVTDPLPMSGPIASWPTYLPAGQSLTAMGTPMAQVAGGRKWENQVYADNDGFRQATYSSPIPCNGASIVMVVKPKRNGTGTSWTSCVDIFYNRLVLGVRNDSGLVCIARNGIWNNSPTAIPDGQVTVLSLVVQPNGRYAVWANGAQIYTNSTLSALTALTNGVAGGYANSVNVGRNDPDGWTTFNGCIGDVFVYTNALADVDRLAMENDLRLRFGPNATRTITASSGPGGSILPEGAVTVVSGTDQTFTLTPSPVYNVSDVLVDGVSQGPITSYTFTGVVTNHTISATFNPITHRINASAGANGSISPNGPVNVAEGAAQTFNFTPNSGYMVDTILADGLLVGRANSYTFTNVLGDHALAVTFIAQVAYTITATAGSGGSISPAGAVQVLQGWNQSFAIQPNSKYAISNLVVDGANLGKRSAYTFTNVLANHTISAMFADTGRDIPRTADLLFSVVTESLPASGSTGNWPTYVPAGTTLTRIGSPTVQQFNGVKWEQNNRITSNDGFLQGQYNSPIPCSGVSIVAAIKPVYSSPGGENRGEIVDIFYDELCLAVSHPDGRIIVSRNNTWGNYGPAIPNGQATILSLVVQTDGSYKVYTNGVQAMAGGADTSPNNVNWSTGMVPGGSGSGDAAFKHFVNVGRNNPDGWSAFNGYIGDVFVYTIALSDPDRQQLETDLIGKFINWTITASAGIGGTISPSGAVSLSPGASQTFAVAPLAGYAITNVVVDSVARGALTAYTFTNVTAAHSISAGFQLLPVTPPTLSIAFNGAGGLDITWPDTAPGSLLTSPVLGLGAAWTPVGITPVVSGGFKKVTVNPGAGTAFYGLGQ